MTREKNTAFIFDAGVELIHRRLKDVKILYWELHFDKLVTSDEIKYFWLLILPVCLSPVNTYEFQTTAPNFYKIL